MHRFDVHRIFFGQKAGLTNYQIRVYGSPRIKAIGTPEADPERVRAAIVLALSQVYDPVTRDLRPVVFYISEHRKEWVKAQIMEMAESLTKRIRSEMSSPERKDQGQKILRLFREWIGNLTLSNVLPSAPPELWTAYGYAETDQIPTWLKRTLG